MTASATALIADDEPLLREALRRQLAIVQQEPVLFHRSLAESIAYGRPDATMAEIEAAARREDVLVLSFGDIDDRLPGEQRQATIGNLAQICAGVSRERLIVAHCG